MYLTPRLDCNHADKIDWEKPVWTQAKMQAPHLAGKNAGTAPLGAGKNAGIAPKVGLLELVSGARKPRMRNCV